VQVANPFAHLIEQLGGPGRYLVRFVGSVMPVYASSMMRYRIDFKHFFGMPCGFVNDCGCGYPEFGQINHKLGPMNTSAPASPLQAALKRNLAELNNAALKLVAHDELVRQDITYARMSFFVIAAQALYNDSIAHAIKVLDEHRDALSFWYILRCKEGVVREAAKGAGLDLTELQAMSAKLRHVREKTHFHIDRKSVRDPKSVWMQANINGQAFTDSIRLTFKTLALTKQDLYGGDLETITEYDGSDVPKLVKAYEQLHGPVHGA
jgi:hypothetical protein